MPRANPNQNTQVHNPGSSKIVPILRHDGCGSCGLQNSCFVKGLSDSERAQVERIVLHHRPLRRGKRLYHAGASANGVFIVRSGALKSYSIDEGGREQVIGFHMPGELLGLDAFATDAHGSTAEALDTTSVCEISHEHLIDLSAAVPVLRKQLLRHMSMAIVSREEHLALLGTKGADGRLAALLVDIAGRFQARGFSSLEFNLSMTRADIANYLGVALETACRLFTRFQRLGLIDINRRSVKIRDLDGLRQLGTESGEPLRRRAGS